MIEIKGNDIAVSQGDTFDVVFALNGYEITKEDIVIFSVKKTTYSEKCLIRKEFTGFDGGEGVQIRISSADMLKLEPGTYVYDLLVVSGDVRTTLNFPAKLEIRRVAHD